MDKIKKHRSHVSGSEVKSRGWSRVPSSVIQQETRKQEVGIDYMNYVSLNTLTVADYTTNTITDTVYWTYSPYQTWGDVWSGDGKHYDDSPTTKIREIIREKEVTMDKRTLFAVYVVDPRKNCKLLMDGKKVIAVNENQAMLKAGVAEVADEAGLDLEQVDVYVQVIGTFIRPRKETQRVKVVKGDD